MKGISTVIATILMLVIAIAMAGLAYSVMTGVFTTRTGVMLGIDGDITTCTTSGIQVFVRNDGTSISGVVTVDRDNGAASCSINSIVGGSVGNCTIGSASPGAGYHSLRAISGGYSARGSVYCPA